LLYTKKRKKGHPTISLCEKREGPVQVHECKWVVWKGREVHICERDEGYFLFTEEKGVADVLLRGRAWGTEYPLAEKIGGTLLQLEGRRNNVHSRPGGRKGLPGERGKKGMLTSTGKREPLMEAMKGERTKRKKKRKKKVINLRKGKKGFDRGGYAGEGNRG